MRWLLATFLLYLLAVPLYLSKVVIPPADAYWLLTPLFIITIYPTRLLIGWVYGSGDALESRRHFTLRWLFKIAMFLLLAAYAFILFAVPYVSPAGFRGALDNHVFLLPIPGFLK